MTERFCMKEVVIKGIQDDVEALSQSRKEDRGLMMRVEDKVDKILYFLLGIFGSIIIGGVGYIISRLIMTNQI